MAEQTEYTFNELTEVMKKNGYTGAYTEMKSGKRKSFNVVRCDQERFIAKQSVSSNLYFFVNGFRGMK